MKEKQVSRLYKIVARLIKAGYLKMQVDGAENLPDEPCVIVANHAQMHGPLACEFYFPVERYTWCESQMINIKEVPDYAFEDFWSEKPLWNRWFYKLLSYIIAPISVFIFSNANTIPVYRDTRVIGTIRETIDKLCQGVSVVIFPECREENNHILYKFQEGFVDTARFYYKKTGKILSFVPMYIAPAFKKMYIGKPTRFDPAAPISDERSRICEYLTNEITQTACALPEHRVVPYKNMAKKNYPSNKAGEVKK